MPKNSNFLKALMAEYLQSHGDSINLPHKILNRRMTTRNPKSDDFSLKPVGFFLSKPIIL